MKKTINVDIKRHGLWLDANVTFAQVDNWFGNTTKDLKFDIVYPHNSFEGVLPCIVWICGGAWMQLDQHVHIPNFIELARSGYIIASVEYRDSNYATFPGQLEDIKSAIRYLRANAKRYHIDSDKIGIMGESAGAHLAAMTAVTGKLKKFDKGQYLDYSSDVQAACPWYLPADFSKFPDRPLEPVLWPESKLLAINLKDNPKGSEIANPILYIDKNTPPTMLIHGDEDKVVPFSQSELFYDALEKKGIPVDLITVKGADHADRHFFQSEILELIQEFFDKYLKD